MLMLLHLLEDEGFKLIIGFNLSSHCAFFLKIFEEYFDGKLLDKIASA